MVIGIPKEIAKGENRVAVVPDVAAKLIKKGFTVKIETNAGLNAGYTNKKYSDIGVEIIENVEELYSSSDIILKVQRPLFNDQLNKNEVNLIKPNSLLIALSYVLHYPEIATQCAERNVNFLSMDLIPRTTLAQKMDALSSQANIAGYKSVILAGNHLKKIFPLLMTAAGTIQPAKVVIMGAGVAGLQALGTAKRLGAIVEVSDVRAAVKEEVESLGGRFISLDSDSNLQDSSGYAKEASEEFLQKQKALLFKHITEADIVITTALVPGKKAPILVTEEMIKNMKPGSVVLDMAVEFGGNCEISESNKTVVKHNVTIIGESNLPSLVATHASEVYSKNLLSLLEHIVKENQLFPKMDDEIVKGALVTYNGEVVNNRVKDLLNIN